MFSTLLSVRHTLASLAILALGVLPASLSAQTLRAVPHAQLKVLDPIWTTAYITRTHGYLVYDTLFGLDENFVPQPQMVDTWTVSEDELEWTFTLRPGLAWHDGAPVTAADCVASLKRWGARDGLGQMLFAQITQIAADSDDTFSIQLSKPFPDMEATLAQMSTSVPFMMPERIAKTDASIPITDPTGSGPYIFSTDAWIPGEMAVYVRNDDYIPRDEPTSLAAGAKIPFLERIEWVSFPSQDDAIAALINNDIQYLESLSTENIADLEGQDGISVVLADAVGSVGMGVFNHQIPPFDNADIRLAAIAAMHQEDYMTAAIGDPAYWQVCGSVYPCRTEHAAPTGVATFIKGDRDQAREMLAQTQYDGTPVILLDPIDSPVLSAFAGVSLEALADVGFVIDHQEMTWAELVQRRSHKTADDGAPWNMFHTWWLATDLAEPTRIAFSGDPGNGWIGWPQDAVLEALRADYIAATTDQARTEIAQKIQDRVVSQGNFAILGQFFEPIAFRNTVVGLQRPIQMYYNLALSDF